MTRKRCPVHDGPLIETGNGPPVCWVSHARGLVGRRIMDLALEGGTVVWIFEGHGCLPLVGWEGNPRAAGDGAEAGALLEVVEGLVLLETGWEAEGDEGRLVVGSPAPCWGIRVRGEDKPPGPP